MISGATMSSAINLSYVLHEPSTSVEVQRACRKLDAERARCIKATRRFTTMTDAALSERVVTLAEIDTASIREATQLQFLSLRVGAWELLPRLVRLAMIAEPNAQMDVDFLDDPDAEALHALPLFRATAALNVPERAMRPGAAFFVSAVFRPRYESILLRFNEIDEVSAASTDDNARWETTRAVAERTVREFTYQWSCPRALWGQPVETTLPEFQTLGNGTIACGR